MPVQRMRGDTASCFGERGQLRGGWRRAGRGPLVTRSPHLQRSPSVTAHGFPWSSVDGANFLRTEGRGAERKIKQRTPEKAGPGGRKRPEGGSTEASGSVE